MEFVDHLFNTSLSQLSTLEVAVGVVLLAVLGLSVAFILCKLMNRAIQAGIDADTEDWYKDPSRWGWD